MTSLDILQDAKKPDFGENKDFRNQLSSQQYKTDNQRRELNFFASIVSPIAYKWQLAVDGMISRPRGRGDTKIVDWILHQREVLLADAEGK